MSDQFPKVEYTKKLGLGGATFGNWSLIGLI
jgi:hypothetical protein